MPYKTTDAAVESSPFYNQYRESELLRKRQEILKKQTDYLSNPKFAETITRDSRGFLVSFADPLAFGKADEELYELITLELKQRNFIQKYSVKFDTEFNFF